MVYFGYQASTEKTRCAKKQTFIAHVLILKNQSIDGADFEISFDFLLVATEIGMTRDPSLCM